jgi:hypothetical protein
MHSDRCPSHSERPLCKDRWLLHELAGMPSKKHGQLSSKHGMPFANLGTLSSNLGMLQPFAGTPYEDEEGICEESRGHRAFHSVPFPVLTMRRLLSLTTLRRSRRRAVGRGHAVPSRREPREREERPSPDQATLRTKLGMPSMQLETPNEEGTMRTAKPRSPHPYPPSLRRFCLR